MDGWTDHAKLNGKHIRHLYRCFYACGAPSNRMDVERQFYARHHRFAQFLYEHRTTIYRSNWTTSLQNKRASIRSPQKISKHWNNEWGNPCFCLGLVPSVLCMSSTSDESLKKTGTMTTKFVYMWSVDAIKYSMSIFVTMMYLFVFM